MLAEASRKWYIVAACLSESVASSSSDARDAGRRGKAGGSGGRGGGGTRHRRRAGSQEGGGRLRGPRSVIVTRSLRSEGSEGSEGRRRTGGFGFGSAFRSSGAGAAVHA